MLGTWPTSAISRSSHPSICPSIDPSSTPTFTSSRPSPPTRSTRSSPSATFSPAIVSKPQPENPLSGLYRAHPISQGSAMDKICPYCQSQHLIKNGSAYGVPKWKCKDCLRQTSFKPPRGEPLWKKETAVLLYTLGLSMNAIAKQLGVSTPAILNWIRAHAATHAPRPQPEPGESVVVMELDELWHFLQKKRTSCGSGWLLIALANV